MSGHMKHLPARAAVGLLCLLFTLCARPAAAQPPGEQPPQGAPLRLNSLFQPHAVFPRDVPLPVWGTAANGQAITVEFAGQQARTVAQDGKWRVTLKPLAASATPRALTVAGGSTCVVEDVLVGDVWLASGQSNMERQLGPRPPQQELVGWKADAVAANFPLIREFYVPHRTAAQPEPDARGSWRVCTPETAADFSAVGFYFARDLQPAVRVPVGVIHSSWGGTVAEAWTSGEALKTLQPGTNAPPAKNQNAASVLYNAMIAPLTDFPIRGVLWYQGESNNGRAGQYCALLKALIADWRQQWRAELPFLVVQIAPHKGMTPELREAQLLAVEATPRTALIVLTDVGDANDIHPTRKQPVGARLALAARALAYGERLVYRGPLFRGAAPEADGHALCLAFDHVGGGLVAQGGGPLRGFTVAGADGKFVAATAEIMGDKVVVACEQVAKPVAVRYGWANVPDVNLANKEGLPAAPFRSDVPAGGTP